MAANKEQSMTPAPGATSLVAVRDARERAIATLSDAFARDDLDMEEFERRLGIAHRTESLVELERLVSDLQPVTPPATSTALSLRPQTAPTRERQRLIAILGGVNRRGYWTPAKTVRVVAMLGGAELDFREASLPPGVTEVHITAILGGVNIIVPPQLAVEMEGIAIMGGFDHSERAAPNPDLERPILRVTGVAVWGGVNIETRLPGESESDAHRRRKNDRKAERRLNARPDPRALPPHE